LRIHNRTFVGDDDGIKELSADRTAWRRLPRLPELGQVFHILPGPAETIYAAFPYHDVGQFRTDGSPVNLPGRFINGMHLAQTQDGSLWVAGSGEGTSRVIFANGRARLIAEPGHRWNSLDIEVDSSNGDLWTCSDRGLERKN